MHDGVVMQVLRGNVFQIYQNTGTATSGGIHKINIFNSMMWRLQYSRSNFTVALLSALLVALGIELITSTFTWCTVKSNT